MKNDLSRARKLRTEIDLLIPFRFVFVKKYLVVMLINAINIRY